MHDLSSSSRARRAPPSASMSTRVGSPPSSATYVVKMNVRLYSIRACGSQRAAVMAMGPATEGASSLTWSGEPASSAELTREDHVAPDFVEHRGHARAPLGQLDLPLDRARLGAVPRVAQVQIDAGQHRVGRAFLVVQLGQDAVGDLLDRDAHVVAGEPGDQLWRLVGDVAALRQAERQRDGHTIAGRHRHVADLRRGGLEQRRAELDRPDLEVTVAAIGHGQPEGTMRLEQRRPLQRGCERGSGPAGVPLATVLTTSRVGAGAVGGRIVVRGTADGDREQDRDGNRSRTSHRGVTVLADVAGRAGPSVPSRPGRRLLVVYKS